MESYTIIDNDIWKDNNIKGYEKLVLIYLVRNFNVNYGYSFPLREQIQEATGISKDTLNKVLNSLEEKGYITRSKREGKAGRNNIYYIHKYLVGQQDSLQASEKPKPSNKSTNNKKQPTGANKKPKKTTWSDHYEEQHWQRYSEDELESKLLKAQAKKKRKELLEDEGLSEKLGYIDAYFSLSNSGLTRDFTDTELEYLASYTIYQVDFVLNSLEAEKIEPKEFLEKLEKVKMKGVS